MQRLELHRGEFGEFVDAARAAQIGARRSYIADCVYQNIDLIRANAPSTWCGDHIYRWTTVRWSPTTSKGADITVGVVEVSRDAGMALSVTEWNRVTKFAGSRGAGLFRPV